MILKPKENRKDVAFSVLLSRSEQKQSYIICNIVKCDFWLIELFQSDQMNGLTVNGWFRFLSYRLCGRSFLFYPYSSNPLLFSHLQYSSLDISTRTLHTFTNKTQRMSIKSFKFKVPPQQKNDSSLSVIIICDASQLPAIFFRSTRVEMLLYTFLLPPLYFFCFFILSAAHHLSLVDYHGRLYSPAKHQFLVSCNRGDGKNIFIKNFL
jgi:hypothetical protein